MKKIRVDESIASFHEHLSLNDRVILSARFGDGKTSFLHDFMDAVCDEYEFIVLYPVNYQIAPNEAIMEYIKRDILFQLVVKGFIRPDAAIPDRVLFQWYISQNISFFADTVRFGSSLPIEDEKWSAAMSALLSLSSHIAEKYNDFDVFKTDINKVESYQQAVSFIEHMSQGKGNIYEMDLITYLIVQAVTQIRKTGKKMALVIEDLDRLDPAHLFRILNVFSAHIDRYYQASTYTVIGTNNEMEHIDQMRNKFGFDHVIFVLDYDATRHIFNHFYGFHANFQGYIGKFISHGVFRFSIREVAIQQLEKHISMWCGIPVDKLFKYEGTDGEFLSKKNISLRCIASLLDDFGQSVIEDYVGIDKEVAFSSKTPLTATIATLRQLGCDDDKIKTFLMKELTTEERINLFGLFLVKQSHKGQSYHVYDRGMLYRIGVEEEDVGIVKCIGCARDEVHDVEAYKFLSVNYDDAYKRAARYVR